MSGDLKLGNRDRTLSEGARAMQKKMLIVIGILLFIGLAACSKENREFTLYKAGVIDPLLAKEMHQELINRLLKGQTDR